MNNFSMNAYNIKDGGTGGQQLPNIMFGGHCLPKRLLLLTTVNSFYSFLEQNGNKSTSYLNARRVPTVFDHNASQPYILASSTS